MNEILTIENFAGINQLEIDLKKINVLIGPQATGKSVIAKLFFYFKGFIWELFSALENEQSKRKLDAKFIEKFEEYFPPPNWGKGNFCIRYKIQDEFVEINRTGEELKVSLQYSEYYQNTLSYHKQLLKERSREEIGIIGHRVSSTSFVQDEMRSDARRKIGPMGIYDQIFIPAGRSFFANLEGSVFTLLSGKIAIDPFLVEFGSLYERVKKFSDLYKFGAKTKNKYFNKLAEPIICGKYFCEKDKDYILAPDGRKINITHSSSGQQETLPLIIILKTLFFKTFLGTGQTVYIEEPEAHMFPTAQRNIVELIATVFNESKDLQFFITTHSPYILTAINNLLQAGQLRTQLEKEEKPERLDALKRVVPPERMLNLDDVAVYSLSDKGCEMIIDQETGLIQTNIIDTVSDELAIQFGKLLDFIE